MLGCGERVLMNTTATATGASLLDCPNSAVNVRSLSTFTQTNNSFGFPFWDAPFPIP